MVSQVGISQYKLPNLIEYNKVYEFADYTFRITCSCEPTSNCSNYKISIESELEDDSFVLMGKDDEFIAKGKIFYVLDDLLYRLEIRFNSSFSTFYIPVDIPNAGKVKKELLDQDGIIQLNKN